MRNELLMDNYIKNYIEKYNKSFIQKHISDGGDSLALQEHPSSLLACWVRFVWWHSELAFTVLPSTVIGALPVWQTQSGLASMQSPKNT